MVITPEILSRFNSASIEENIHYLDEVLGGDGVFSTSFGLEDQAITHILATGHFPVSLFTLDTGRLFPETYSTWSSTTSRYNINIEAYYPRETDLQAWVTEHGPNAFYESVENRKECCNIRKVKPLNRALQGAKVWITGLRAEQSDNRKDMPMIEWDEQRQLYKFNPLINWS